MAGHGSAVARLGEVMLYDIRTRAISPDFERLNA